MYCKSRLETIKRSSTNDHQKSHRTHWQFKKISRYRVTGCVTQAKTKGGSISTGIVLIPFLEVFEEKSLKQNCLSIKYKVREVNTSTAELYIEQGNTDLSDLMVINEMIQCKVCKDSMQKEKIVLHMWSPSARIISRDDKHVEKYSSASDDSLVRFCSGDLTKTSNKAPQSVSPRSSNRKASFPEGTKEEFQRLCREMGQRRRLS